MIQRPTDVRNPNFISLLTLFVAQQNQDAANQKTHDEWQQAANNWLLRNQQNQAIGLPIDAAPALPAMTLYLDDGTTNHPPFPDLKVPTLAPPAVLVPAHGIAADPDKVPPDRQDAALLLLVHIAEQNDKLLAVLGVK